MKIANDAEIKLQVKIDDNSASEKVNSLNKQGTNVNKTFNNIGTIGKKAFKTFTVGVTTASTALTGLIGYGVKYNAEIEQLQTSFEVMSGSAEKAVEITKKLKQMGAMTPFETKDLAEVTQLLMNYGLTADDAIEKMSMLGDISQGNAEKMNRIAMAYGQMSSAGKVQLEDIKQMIEAGFNPLKEISDSTGESMESLYDRISKGKISVDEITDSMKRSTSEGGKYFKSMEKQSKTLNGQISTLKDNFSSLAGVLANDVSGKLSSTILPDINKLIGDMESTFEKDGIEAMIKVMSDGITKMLVKIIAKLPDFINVGTMIIQSIINGFNDNSELLTQSIIMTLSNLIVALLEMSPQFLQLGIDLIVNIISGIAQQAPILIPQIVETMLELFMILTSPENIEKLTDAGIALILALIQGIINSIPVLLENSNATLSAFLSVLSGGTTLIRKIGFSLLKSLIKGLGDAIPQMLNSAGEYTNKLIEAFAKGIEKIKDVGKNLIKGLWNGINDAKNWVLNKIRELGSSVLKAFKDIFGINSPSKEFSWIGKMNVIGLEEGMEDNIPDLNSTIDRTIKYGYDTTGLDFLQNGADNISSMFSNGMIFGASSSPIYITVNADMQMDKFGQVFVGGVKTFSNGAKNTYNFGGGIK